MKTIYCIFISLLLVLNLHAEDGHNLWLRHKNAVPVTIVCSKTSATLSVAKQELEKGWQGKTGTSVVLTLKTDKTIKGDGFKLTSNGIQANTELGILYGVYELLRRQQTGETIQEELCNPSYERRILNHWDNLNGTIERGYAGHSIFWRKGADSLVVTLRVAEVLEQTIVTGTAFLWRSQR
ncbi:MAG TPA: hypothetical protein VHO72_11700, partial [Bacteroidales bacterium]|nr:hypothetical protein [Bacteroidales bacterium]